MFEVPALEEERLGCGVLHWDRLLRWTIAWAWLSAAWHREQAPVGNAADVIEFGLLAERALG